MWTCLPGRELRAHHPLRLDLLLLAVALRRRDAHRQLVSRALAHEGLLEAGDDVARAVEVDERLPLGGAVELLPRGVGEDVLEGDDFAVGDGRFFAHGGRL